MKIWLAAIRAHAAQTQAGLAGKIVRDWQAEGHLVALTLQAAPRHAFARWTPAQHRLGREQAWERRSCWELQTPA